MIKILIIALFSTTIIVSQPFKNVIFICIDGTSRNTLYALINKGEMDGFNKVIQRGNYKNMMVAGKRLTNDYLYYQVLTGLNAQEDYKKTPDYKSIFDQIKQYQLFRTTAFIPSTIKATDPRIRTFLINEKTKNKIDYFHEEIPRSQENIKGLILSFLKKKKYPFFMFANIPQVANIGNNYREGAQRYSAEIKKADAVLLDIIVYLEEEGLMNKTEIVLLTQHGFMKNSQIPSSEIWIASTKKILIKGKLEDVVPTLMDLMDMNTNQLPGKSLIRQKSVNINKEEQFIF